MKVNPFKTTLYSSVLLAGLAATSVAAADEAKDVTATTDTEDGMAWNKIGEIKHEYLPQVVMAKDFDAAWAEYMDAYNSCDPGAFIGELQTDRKSVV